MPSSSEADQPPADADETQAKPEPKTEPKHWLEYAIFVFVVATAAATGAAACYTRQQWLTALDQEKRSLRAYVAVSTTDPIKIDSQKMTITVDNFGQTPAKDITMFSSWEFMPFGEPLPSDFGFPEKPGCSAPTGQDKVKPGIGILMPKNPLAGTHNHCPDELAYLLQAERKELNAFYYGHIEYSDIFNERHHTTFCFLYWPFEQRSIVCDRHNEIDPDE
jgi:hypothetical protein